MSEPKYDGRDARAILGPLSEQVYPSETTSAKWKAAIELLAALTALGIPGVTVAPLAKAGRPVELAIGAGKGRFGDPLFVAMIDYDVDGMFSVTVNGRREEISLVFNHAEQRFEGEVGPDATEEQRKRSALATVANKLVSMATPAK